MDKLEDQTKAKLEDRDKGPRKIDERKSQNLNTNAFDT